MMTSKERMLMALRGECPDQLPVTTHHVMPSFLDSHMEGKSDQEFFDIFGLDPIRWIIAYAANESAGDYYDPGHTELGFLEARRVSSDSWRFKVEKLDNKDYDTSRFSLITKTTTLPASASLHQKRPSPWCYNRISIPPG